MSTRFNLCMDAHLGAPDSKRAFNRALFTEVAPRYDFVTRALSMGRDGAWKNRLVKELPAWPAPFCADLACGTGDITRRLSARYPDGRILGLDLTPSMLEAAKRHGVPSNVDYQVGDMNALPLADASVDVLTGGYALRNAPDLSKALAEIRRVVKEGGYAAFLDFSKPASRPIQRVFDMALKAWGGFWGWLLHRNPDVYGYIAASLRTYPDRDALRSRFEADGWRVISVRRLYFGLLELIVLRKESAHAGIA